MRCENICRGISRTTPKSSLEHFVTKVNKLAVNFCHKGLHLIFCGSDRYASDLS